MVKKAPKVVIENEAKKQLRQAYNHIREDSLQNAENVKANILASIEELSQHPERHPPDKYKTDNDGIFRAYELYKYRYRLSCFG